MPASEAEAVRRARLADVRGGVFAMQSAYLAGPKVVQGERGAHKVAGQASAQSGNQPMALSA